jgi:hypothetical protein
MVETGRERKEAVGLILQLHIADPAHPKRVAARCAHRIIHKLSRPNGSTAEQYDFRSCAWSAAAERHHAGGYLAGGQSSD